MRRSPTPRGWNRLVAVAAAHGLLASSGPTLARWLTDEPYSARIILYDVTVCVTAFAVAYFCAWRLLPRAALSRHWGPIGASVAMLLLAFVWGVSLLASAPVLQIAGGALLLGATGLFVRGVRAGRSSLLTLEWFAIVLGAAVAWSLSLKERSPLALLLFPSASLTILAYGPPRSEPRLTVRAVPPLLAALALIVACSLTVHPHSAQRIDLPAAADPAAGRALGAGSVVMIVIDTLRRDHLSLYGYRRETTPHLDRWAQSALVFDNATAASCWTLPSHASIFTGLYPRTHGAHGYRGRGRGINAHPLPEEAVTLAELAREDGVATAAVVANAGYLAPRFGVAQGFTTYWARAPRHPVAFPPADWLARTVDRDGYLESRWAYYRGRYVTDNAIRWLEHVGERRFFLFLNYMDVHGPSWRPPNEAVPRLAGEEGFVDPGEDRRRRPAYFLELGELPDHVRAYRVSHYDRELIYLDAQLARLFRFLDASGLARTTTVIVTSDHGEYFGEHGMTGHSGHLHDEVVNVPLIVKGPAVSPGRTSRPTHGVDLFGAVLDFLGVEGGRRPGTYFPILEDGHPPIVSEWYASENAILLEPRMKGRFDRDLRAIKVRDLKLLAASDGTVELHDLAAAGGEAVDLAASRPADVARLRAALDDWLEASPPASRPPASDETAVDEEVRDRLRALGYLD